MIVVCDDRKLCTYARVNRRVQWRYAEWCGRWATLEDALASVRRKFPQGRVEYRVEDRVTDEVKTGFMEG